MAHLKNLVDNFRFFVQYKNIIHKIKGQIGLFVFLFSIGMEVVVEGRRFLRVFLSWTPNPKYRAPQGDVGCLWSLSRVFW